MHGLLVLDKPPGVTSSRALLPLREALGPSRRVGHAGTLDPFATGVLLALTGDATRLSELATGLEKTYEASVRFGEETDTLDPEGEVVRAADPGEAPPPDLDARIAALRGEIDQVPPAFSALKVGGRRAYRLARAGRAADLPPRRVTIHEIRRLSSAWPEVRILVRCGAGTYLRSLARDLGRALGIPAHLVALRRTAVGPFAAAGAARPDDVAAIRERLVPPLGITRAAGVPEVVLDPEAARAFAEGRPALAPGEAGAPGGRAVAVVSSGRLVGLARRDGDLLRPVRVLASARDHLLAQGERPRRGVDAGRASRSGDGTMPPADQGRPAEEPRPGGGR